MMEFPDDENLKAALYPLAIRQAPYEGMAEGAAWIAIPNCVADPLESEVYQDIWSALPTAFGWWAQESNRQRIGVGDTPNDALSDLVRKVYYSIYEVDPLEDWDDELTADQEAELELIAEEHTRDVVGDVLSLLSLQIEAVEEGNFDELTDLIDELESEWEDKGYSSPFQLFIPAMLTFGYFTMSEIASKLPATPGQDGKPRKVTARDVLQSMSRSRKSFNP